MIKDLQLMKDITPLFEKNVIVWGIGAKGRVLVKQMKAMGAGKRGIVLCDSKNTLWGEKILGHTVMSPAEMKRNVESIGVHNVIMLVTVLSVMAQNEIIKCVEEMFGAEIDVYTEYAVEYGLYFGINAPYVDNDFRKKELLGREIASRYPSSSKLRQLTQIYKYFTFLPLHNDEIILVYQPGKVASSTIYNSIRNYNRNVLHCHTLAEVCDRDDDLYKLLRLKSGKIISLVRDPVARRISEMWQNIANLDRYAIDADFDAVERYYFDCPFEDTEFGWFKNEMEKTFHLNVYDYPFDREKGYSIIRQGNIELLLMKMEKLNGLENIIGEFLGIKDFQLQRHNVGNEKLYRFALKEYKTEFAISQVRIEEIYKQNKCMRHFYLEQECDELYEKWMRKSKNR